MNFGTEPFYNTVAALLRQIVGADSSCIDTGCGPGRITAEIARLSSELVIGIDRSHLMIEFATAIVSGPAGSYVELPLGNAQGVVPALGLSNCAFAVGDAQHLPVADESMDVAALCNVLHRVPKPLAALSELHRVLRRAGRAVVSNSYDWTEEITPRALSFDNVTDILDTELWTIGLELDYRALLVARQYPEIYPGLQPGRAADETLNCRRDRTKRRPAERRPFVCTRWVADGFQLLPRCCPRRTPSVLEA